MTGKTALISKEKLENDIDTALANLKENFKPEEWTKEERQEVKENLAELKDLAESILKL